MPELPEVETVRRGLEAAMSGPGRAIRQLVLNRKDLRYPFTAGMAEAVQGQSIKAFGRRGKYMILDVSGNNALVWHLGMSGRVRVYKENEAYSPELHDHAVFHLENGATISFNDPRRFGFLVLYAGNTWQNQEPFASMGPEPLGNEFNAPILAERLRGRKTPIKSALLDQKVVAGLGNIYVCEALYQAGINPLREAGDIAPAKIEALAAAIRDVLTRALESGGSSLRDYRQTDGSLGYFQHGFSVYDREGVSCPACTKACTIKRIVQSGRSTFYCPTRQT